MSEQDLYKKFIDMSEKEQKYSQELADIANKFKHPVLKALIYAVSRDSEKHRFFYYSLAQLVKSSQPVLTEEEFKYIAEGIDKHIQVEKEMIEYTQRLLNETKDPRMKIILAAIYEDEVKHHKLLVTIKDKIARRETLTEEELWDMIWKDSPWHGTPGG